MIYSTRATISLPAQYMKAIDEIATQELTSRSAIIKQAIKKYLGEKNGFTNR